MDKLLDDFNPASWARFLIDLVTLWSSSITDPKALLNFSFSPTDAQILAGLTFYLEMMVLSLVLQSPVILGHKAEFGDKLRMIASALCSLASLALCAGAVDLSFRLLGGGSAFAGSFLAFAYGFTPYGPLLTLASLMMVVSVPADLRPYLMNALTAQEAGKRAAQDERTNRPVFMMASILLLIVMILAFAVLFRCLMFVHHVHGLRAVASIILAIIALAIVGVPLKYVSASIMPIPSEDGTSAPQTAGA